MTDAPSDNSFIDDAQPENDVRLGKMADALGCTAKLIQETWQMLGIDSFDDPHELSSVQEAADIYLSAGKHAARLSEMLSSLPEAEVERLTVERNDVVKSSIVSTRTLSEELLALHAQRKSVIDRNPRRGGSDPRADKLAELVALIFEHQGRKVTFGLTDAEPSTHFCKSVRDVLVICESKRFQKGQTVYVTDWRQPSRKAFLKRKPDTNEKKE